MISMISMRQMLLKGQIHLLDAVLQPDLVVSFAGGMGWEVFTKAMSCELRLCHYARS